jgi:hypothetical protein
MWGMLHYVGYGESRGGLRSILDQNWEMCVCVCLYIYIYMNDFFILLRSLLFSGYQGLFPWGQSGRGVKLTTHLHLVPKSKNVCSYASTSLIRFHGVVLS